LQQGGQIGSPGASDHGRNLVVGRVVQHVSIVLFALRDRDRVDGLAVRDGLLCREHLHVAETVFLDTQGDLFAAVEIRETQDPPGPEPVRVVLDYPQQANRLRGEGVPFVGVEKPADATEAGRCDCGPLCHERYSRR
jgi:hypothetical protein